MMFVRPPHKAAPGPSPGLGRGRSSRPTSNGLDRPAAAAATEGRLQYKSITKYFHTGEENAKGEW